MIEKLDPDANGSGFVDYSPFLRELINRDDVLGGGQSALGAGALLLPSANAGLVLMQVDDSGNGGTQSAESAVSPIVRPMRRLHRKTTLTSEGSPGAKSRSVTPPQRRSRDGSASAASSPSGLNPEADERLPDASRRRLDVGGVFLVAPASVRIHRPGWRARFVRLRQERRIGPWESPGAIQMLG